MVCVGDGGTDGQDKFEIGEPQESVVRPMSLRPLLKTFSYISAFCLRSGVVCVLSSLISDMSSIQHNILNGFWN